MTIARRGLEVKIIGQGEVMGPTSIEGSFSRLQFVEVTTDYAVITAVAQR